MQTPNDRLQQARIRAGHSTASEAARLFGWNENTYRSHENGERGLKLTIAQQYARAFGVSVSWILVGQGNTDGESIVKIHGYIEREGFVKVNSDPESDHVIVPPIPIPSHLYCYMINGDFLYPRFGNGDILFTLPPVHTNLTDESLEGIVWITESIVRFGFFYTSSYQKYHLEMQGMKPITFDEMRSFGAVELVIRENRYHTPRLTKRSL